MRSPILRILVNSKLVNKNELRTYSLPFKIEVGLNSHLGEVVAEYYKKPEVLQRLKLFLFFIFSS